MAVLLYGAFASFYNPRTRALAAREDKPLNMYVMTSPPMFVSYNPRRLKVIITVVESGKIAGVNPANIAYLEPSTKERAEFWEICKNNLTAWHHKPYIIFDYIYQYAKLRIAKRTNITVSDFIMISLDLMRLKPADFIVPIPDNPQRAKAQPSQIILAQDLPAQPQTPKTLVLEILNASGQAGLAADVTRYLRDLSNNASLDIDVINYASYPRIEQKTKIIDLAGRQEDLKKTANSLGLNNNEIFTAVDKTAISDARIILGKDFVMPKNK